MTTASDATLGSSLLLLADSRLPAGGHAHSGGIEQAVATGAVRDLATLESFLRGGLATAGAAAAAVAAHAARSAARGSVLDCAPADRRCWDRLDAEVSARMPSRAQRTASRTQGRALLRVLGACWPDPVLALLSPRPHHAVALGVGVHLAGGTRHDAATLAAVAAVNGPAAAALRLLGFDPVEVTGLLARMAPEVDRCAADATGSSAVHDPALLPAPSGLMLDVLAEDHARTEAKLFAS